MKTLGELYQLWGVLADIPTNDQEEIEVEFIHFEKGTHRENIWHWFESQNKHFVVGEIQSGIRKSDQLQALEQA
jgi:hypothetical protein